MEESVHRVDGHLCLQKGRFNEAVEVCRFVLIRPCSVNGTVMLYFCVFLDVSEF